MTDKSKKTVDISEMVSYMTIIEHESDFIIQQQQELLLLRNNTTAELNTATDKESQSNILSCCEVEGKSILLVLKKAVDRFVEDSKKLASLMKKDSDNKLKEADKSDFENHLLRIKRVADAEIMLMDLNSFDFAEKVNLASRDFDSFISFFRKQIY